MLDKDSFELKVLADVVIKIQKKPLVAVKNYHHHHLNEPKKGPEKRCLQVGDRQALK